MAFCKSVSDLKKTASEKLECTWNIPKFLETRKDVNLIKKQCIRLKMGQSIGLDTTWTVYLTCQKDKQQNWIQLFLKPIQFPQGLTKIPVTFEFKISKKHNLGNKFIIDREISFGTGGWGFNIILQEGDCSYLDINEDGDLQIKIVCTIWKPVVEPSIALASHQATFETAFKNKLCSDMSQMYGQFLVTSDYPIRIWSKDGKEFPVNRAIVVARSPLFKTMFQRCPNEVIEIPDHEISSEPLNVLLHFIHTGILQNCWQKEGIIEELVYGAYKYGQTDLLQYFDLVLSYVCTNTNCGKLMGLAKQLNLKNAEKGLLDYFKANLTEVGQVMQFAQFAAINWIAPQGS